MCGSRILHVFNCEVKLKKESFEAMLLLQKREKLSRLCFVIENTQIIKFLFKRRINYQASIDLTAKLEKEGKAFVFAPSKHLNLGTFSKDAALEQKLFLLFPVWR